MGFQDRAAGAAGSHDPTYSPPRPSRLPCTIPCVHTPPHPTLFTLNVYHALRHALRRNPQGAQPEYRSAPGPSAADADHVDPLFICPITQEVMRDPVIASDGYT